MSNPREAAFRALLEADGQQRYAFDSLEEWDRRTHPSCADYRLAQQLASGAMRWQRALDHQAKALTAQGQLPRKRKERWLLRLGLYQLFHLDRVPPFAVVHEMVTLAKKMAGGSFAGFLNATLRKAQNAPPPLPQGNRPEEIGTRLSYPDWLVEKWLAQEGLSRTLEWLERGNDSTPHPMARMRGSCQLSKVLEGLLPVAALPLGRLPPEITDSRDYYIQNATPVHLMVELAKRLPSSPKTILDFCAAPGGKLLAAHDLFPQAELHAHDVSEPRLDRLRENLKKYDVHAKVWGPETKPPQGAFDLVILDVPCSNTGVLHKRPEARWRLSQEEVDALRATQTSLLTQARHLLRPGGWIWYLTCSLLQEENRPVTEGEDWEYVVPPFTVPPNAEGWDGGGGCALRIR